MKKYFFAIAILAFGFSVPAFAQAPDLQVRSISNKLISLGHVKTGTTTDSTLAAFDSLAIMNNSAGIVVVTVVASDSLGNGVTLKGTYRYHKSAGTLTLASVTNQSALTTDAGLGTATTTFTVTATNNLVIKIKGKLGYTVRWRSRIEQFYP